MAKKTDIKNVLVVRFSALGDVAMTIPVIYDACAENPGVNFVVLTRKAPAKMFLCPPPNLKVVGVNLDQYKGTAGMWRLLKEMIASYDIDTLVDLHDVLRTKLLRLFARMKGISVSSIDKGRKERKALTRHRKKAMVPLTPVPERYREAFVNAGLNVCDKFRNLFPSGKADTSAIEWTGGKLPGEKWIAIAPFAAHEGKRYPLTDMRKIIVHYASLPGYRLFLFGAGRDERELIEEMSKGFGNIVSMAEKEAGLDVELALMSHCDVMISMDSANMHLASLVGLRTVSVWGATHPYTGFFGFRQDPSDAVQLDMTCRPCSIYGKKKCARGDYHCLEGISPQLIISRIDSKL